MTRLAAATASLFLLAGAGLAQDEAALTSKVKEIRYPPLAAAAEVQGDVRLRSGPQGIVPISGHPLLVQKAIVSAQGLGEIPERTGAEFVFHFSLIDTTVREVTVRRGDAFDRLVLRILRLRTGKTIKECAVNSELPENRIDWTKTPIEIRVYGGRRCPMTESAGVAGD